MSARGERGAAVREEGFTPGRDLERAAAARPDAGPSGLDLAAVGTLGSALSPPHFVFTKPEKPATARNVRAQPTIVWHQPQIRPSSPQRRASSGDQLSSMPRETIGNSVSRA